eukprot:604235-Amphidinium_carterae.1
MNTLHSRACISRVWFVFISGWDRVDFGPSLGLASQWGNLGIVLSLWESLVDRLWGLGRPRKGAMLSQTHGAKRAENTPPCLPTAVTILTEMIPKHFHYIVL